MNNTERLKVLGQRLNNALTDLKVILAKRDDLESRSIALRAQIKRIEREIADIENAEISVSEHCLVRYLERVLGYDLEVIKASLINPVQSLGQGMITAGEFPVKINGESFRVVVKRNTIVTILEN